MPQSAFITSFMQGFEDGRKSRADKQKQQQDLEEHEFQLKQRKAQLALDSLQAQQLRRNLEKQNYDLMTGAPGTEASVQQLPMAPLFPAKLPGDTAEPKPIVPEGSRSMLIPGTKLPPVDFSPIDMGELGILPGFQKTPPSLYEQSMERERLRQQAQADAEAESERTQRESYAREQAQAAFRTPPAARQDTAAVQEYNFYADQERAAGRTPISFDAYQERDANRRRTAGATTIDTEWVIRGGKPVQITKGTAQPGDRPYSANAIQQEDAGDGYADERALRTLATIDELIPKVSRYTVGLGSLAARIPETQAREFATQLDSLKASIAFNELTAMRAASKTGGALGNVSNVELKLLESALGGLDTGQSPAAFKASLQKIRGSIERWRKARAANTGASGGAGRNPAIEATANELGISYQDAEASLRKQGLVR